MALLWSGEVLLNISFELALYGLRGVPIILQYL